MNSIFRVRFAWYLVAAVVAGLLLHLVAPKNVPDYLDWVRERFLPWLSSRTGVELHLDLEQVTQALADSLRADNDVLKALLPKLTTGGAALIGFFTAVLALPASAALLVGLRHLRAQYLASDLYKS